MRIRLTLDINTTELLRTAFESCLPFDASTAIDRLESRWQAAQGPLVCLSVRSALDLLLSALDLSKGDEVLISAITLPDMEEVIRAHQLIPVPIDVDRSTMAPSLDQLRERSGPRSRLFLFAHLFGGWSPLEDALDYCRSKKIPVVEDCAQGWLNSNHCGHPDALASLFSFGTIKSPTALGGALADVRDVSLLKRMKLLRDSTEVQKQGKLLLRAVKTLVIRMLTSKRLYPLVIKGLEANGYQLEKVLRKAVRGFPAAEIPQILRQRPCAAQSRLLLRRLGEEERLLIAERIEIATLVASELPPGWRLIGGGGLPHTHWVFPVMGPRGIEVESVCRALRSAGFDASGQAALGSIGAPAEFPDLDAPVARDLRERMIFLPLHPPLPSADRQRMLEVLDACAAGALR